MTILRLTADDLTGALDTAAQFTGAIGPPPVLLDRTAATPAFKKVDSLLRGHWAPELAEIVQSGLFRRIVFAPAVPGHGRLTRGGLQVLAQPSGAYVAIKDIPGSLSVMAFRLADAESDADLEAIAKRYANEPRRSGAALLDWPGRSHRNRPGLRAR